jgi:hypothetical protein
MALGMPQVLRVQTGIGLAGVLLRQGREHILQGGLLQVQLFYPTSNVCHFTDATEPRVWTLCKIGYINEILQKKTTDICQIK